MHTKATRRQLIKLAGATTLAAARAFGRLNLLEVRVQDGQVQLGEKAWPVHGLQNGAGLLAFRYEDLYPNASGLSAHVLAVYGGRGERLCRVKLGPGEVVVRLGPEVRPGDEVRLAPARQLRVFGE